MANSTLNTKREDNTSKIDQVELDKLFNFVWLSMYRANGARKDKITEENYRNLQARIIKKAVKKLGEYEEANLLAQLKLVDILYKEIVENDLPSIAKAQGISQEQVKELLYQKIFGREKKVEKTEQSIEGLSTLHNEVEAKKDIINFDNLYDSTLVASSKDGEKDIQYKGVSCPQTIEYHDENRRITITALGNIEYQNAFSLRKDIGKYSVMIYTKKGKEPTVDICTVFGRLDFSRAENNEEYRRIVFKELVSQENINRQGNAGYIGEVVAKDGTKQEEHEVIYDAEDYTAVKEYTKQKERKLQEILDEVRGESK